MSQSISQQMLEMFKSGLKPEAFEYKGGRPTTKEELRDTIHAVTGLWVPNKAVCHDHSAPMDAVAAAFFAEDPVVAWVASRGLGGKSVLLAALSMTEAAVLGASVNLLGGSGEQSQRVHDYMTGEDTNLPDKFWGYQGAPKYLLRNNPTKRETRLANNGRIKTLLASQRSVRGPHPNRLRCDEVDEMELEILQAAMGQPLPARGITDQTVLSSTHQYADGTMTWVLEEAHRKGWPTFHWCFRESMEGWLTEAAVERKKASITAAMWRVEFELQQPSPQSRAILPEKAEAMFRHDLGMFEPLPGEELRFEEPVRGGIYVHGADWAKENDLTVMITVRIDVVPHRVVAFQHVNRRPWPDMVSRFDERVKAYPGEAIHDATGLGNVVDDIMETDAYGMVLNGAIRKNIFSEYIKGIENGEIVCPYIAVMASEHKYCRVNDVYGSGHPPDSFVAGALAWRLIKMGWVD